VLPGVVIIDHFFQTSLFPSLIYILSLSLLPSLSLSLSSVDIYSSSNRSTRLSRSHPARPVNMSSNCTWDNSMAPELIGEVSATDTELSCLINNSQSGSTPAEASALGSNADVSGWNASVSNVSLTRLLGYSIC